MNSLFEILSPSFVLRNALYSSLLVGAFLPPLGVHLVLGRRSILALTLPQVSTLGVALVVWLGSIAGVHFESGGGGFLIWALAGSLAAIAAALFWQFLFERPARANAADEYGAQYAVAAALTLALAASRRLTEIGLLDKLKGEVLAVPDSLLLAQCAAFALIGAALMIFSRPFQFLLFDRALCAASGLPVGFLNGLSTLLLAAGISIGGLCVGPLSVFAFLLLPPLMFLPFVKSIGALYKLSAAAGIVGAFAGFWASYALEDWNLPVSSAQIIVLGILWAAARAACLLIRKSR